MDTEDDPVVQEIPVFLSKAFEEQLYIFQQPLKPSHTPFDTSTVIHSKIKTIQQQLELEIEISTRSVNYDQSRGEQIAINAGGSKGMHASSEGYFESNKMDKIKLVSSRAQPGQSCYAVGYLLDNELHLNAVETVLTMRTTFDYLDKAAKKAREEAKDVDGDSDEEEPEKAAQAVTVRFAKAESEAVKKARERSYPYWQRKLAEEPWITTDFVPFNTDTAQLERTRLSCQQRTEENGGNFTIPGKTYVQSLIPKQASLASPAMDSATFSLQEVKALSLNDQVRILLTTAHVVKFSHLLSWLGPQYEATNVLRAVQQYGCLVQGYWIIKSEVLYPKDTRGGVNGIPADILSRGRDHILYLFTQSASVEKSQIVDETRLPNEEIKHILLKFAVLKPESSSWEFKHACDTEFIKKYTDVCQRQTMLWDAKKQQRKSFKVPKAEPGSPTRTRRPRRRSHRDSLSSDNESGSETTPGTGRKGRKPGVKSAKTIKSETE